MDFDKLAELYDQLENTSSGNAMREILAEFFRKVPKEDIAMVAYLTLGSIGSDYDNIVLGMADKSVLKSISVAGGTDLSKVKRLMQETGDAGLTAEKVLKHKPQTLVPVGKLAVEELFNKLHNLTKESGSGSQETKSNILVNLLQKTSASGAKYVVRIALGQLRMGVGDMTVLDALAIAYTGDKKNKETLERAFNICPDVGVIAETLASKGLKAIERIDVHVGRPIKPMLAQRVKELEEVSKKMPGEITAEAKYDGERIQVHKAKGKITLFSRRLDNITGQFPDLIRCLDKDIRAKEFVIEGEVLAIGEEGNHLPFQTLMQRRRKHDIEEYIKKIPVIMKLFDLLYLDGKSYLHESYLERTKQLEKIVNKSKHLQLADRFVSQDLDKINDFFHDMLDEKFEGIIMKSHSGEYQAGTRGWNWIKWKKDYAQEMSDTLDLVIVGAFHGKGKRAGAYGALLCACYDEKNDIFLTVCKLGSGLTDQVLGDLPEMLKKYKLERRPARLKVSKEMQADVWFEPKIVVEVLGAEITKSPFHTAGLALRFPRFIKFRGDKKAELATSLKEIEKMG